MPHKRAIALMAAVVAGGVVAGCTVAEPAAPGGGPTPVADYGLTFFVRNETDRAVVVVVDGVEVLRVGAGERIRGSGRPVLVSKERPNTIEVRTANGHVFGSFTSDTPGQFGVPGFVGNTRCGDVWVWLDRDISAEIAPLPREQQPPCD